MVRHINIVQHNRYETYLTGSVCRLPLCSICHCPPGYSLSFFPVLDSLLSTPLPSIFILTLVEHIPLKVSDKGCIRREKLTSCISAYSIFHLHFMVKDQEGLDFFSRGFLFPPMWIVLCLFPGWAAPHRERIWCCLLVGMFWLHSHDLTTVPSSFPRCCHVLLFRTFWPHILRE